MKTEGLVVWRSGTNIVLYRGADYKYPCFFSGDNSTNGTSNEEASICQMDCGEDEERKASSSGGTALTSSVPTSLSKVSHPPLIQGVGTPNRVRFQLPGEAKLAEKADCLLEGIGPRLLIGGDVNLYLLMLIFYQQWFLDIGDHFVCFLMG